MFTGDGLVGGEEKEMKTDDVYSWCMLLIKNLFVFAGSIGSGAKTEKPQSKRDSLARYALAWFARVILELAKAFWYAIGGLIRYEDVLRELQNAIGTELNRCGRDRPRPHSVFR